jgi:hypothetical protein
MIHGTKLLYDLHSHTVHRRKLIRSVCKGEHGLSWWHRSTINYRSLWESKAGNGTRPVANGNMNISLIPREVNQLELRGIYHERRSTKNNFLFASTTVYKVLRYHHSGDLEHLLEMIAWNNDASSSRPKAKYVWASALIAPRVEG